MKQLKFLTTEQVKEIASILLSSDLAELERLSKRESNASNLQRYLALVIIKGMKEENAKISIGALDPILDRIIGKPKEFVETKDVTPPTEIVYRVVKSEND